MNQQKINLKSIWDKLTKNTPKELMLKLFNMNGKPSKTALSVSIGLFIGLFIPMGFQSFFSILLALFLNCNVVLTVIATFITNPFTAIPIYFTALRIGEWITAKQISWEKFAGFFKHPQLDNFLSISGEGIYVFIIGAFILALVVSISAYMILYYAIKVYRKNDSAQF